MYYDTYSPENWPSFYDEMIDATHSDECETEYEIEFDYEPSDNTKETLKKWGIETLKK